MSENFIYNLLIISFMADQDNTQTIFNSAVASLERLHRLLESCNEFSTLAMIPNDNVFERVKYLKTWKHLVAAVFKEICPKLTESEIKKLDAAFNRFNNFPSVIKHHVTEEGNIPYVDTITFNKTANFITKIERYLRTLADKRGMLIPDSTADLLKPENW